jgi:hypothetical protein
LRTDGWYVLLVDISLNYLRSAKVSSFTQNKNIFVVFFGHKKSRHGGIFKFLSVPLKISEQQELEQQLCQQLQ